MLYNIYTSEVRKIQKIKKKNLSNEVYEILRRDISQGRFLEGTKIPSENQLAKSMNVSRVVVRDALKALRDEHFIVTHHGKGSFIANPKNFLKQNESAFKITYEEFCEIMEFRSCIELSSIKLAVERAADSELRELLFHLDEMKKSIDDVFAFTQKDFYFHLAIIKASHNRIFYETTLSKHDQIFQALILMNKLNDSRTWAISLHEKLAEEIISKNASAAIALLKNNGEYNLARIKEFIG